MASSVPTSPTKQNRTVQYELVGEGEHTVSHARPELTCLWTTDVSDLGNDHASRGTMVSLNRKHNHVTRVRNFSITKFLLKIQSEHLHRQTVSKAELRGHNGKKNYHENTLSQQAI
jgi:hypothetical protein